MKDKQTFGQWLKWDFEANGDLEINDKNGKAIYFENWFGFWVKCEYDSNLVIYQEDSNKHWVKREFDSEGKVMYYEDSDGQIADNRSPEIIEHKDHKYQLIR